MATSFISAHHGGGWRYQFHIPVVLRPLLFGKKKTAAFVRYIRRTPRREAEEIARKWAVEDAATLRALRGVPPHDQKDMAQAGGLDVLLEGSECLDPHTPPTKEQISRELLEGKANLIKYRMQAAKPAALEVSWGGLFEAWQRVSGAEQTRHHASTIRLLKEFFGQRDCRQITSQGIARFRNDLLPKTTREMARRHLERTRHMFSAAARDELSPLYEMDNPATSVKVLGKNPPKQDGEDRPFTLPQVRTILETADRIRFGGNMHETIKWILRLLTYTGARPNEICQLQGGDVQEKDGVKVIQIQKEDAVTGKKHPKKSVKTGGKFRRVPLHSDVLEFFDYAAKFGKEDFIFGDLPWTKANKWSTWTSNNFGRFLRDECHIIDPSKRLSLYSLRHSFHNAMDVAGVPDKIQRRLTGHKPDVHGGYGGDLALLKEWMEKIKPFG